ncbi:RHS repeat domain-containing protein, partial [Taibaiella koreensis]|uniref:RHS repeat domain-containing protein n=1 Tax=Taibaiella koreensis TaxID=1268548 RepID=UPI001968AA6B
LAVYLSSRWRNLSCVPCGNIFFDKLNVEVSKGNLLEETHYYPHGLPIKPLSSVQAPAGGYRDNRRKYQSNEYIQDLGLNWMSFGARQYDPQIGRFLSVDPLADAEGQQIFSPYAAMGNAPESMIDPNGTFAYVKDFGNTKAEAISMLDAMFGNGNYKVDEAGDGRIDITNPVGASAAFQAFMNTTIGGGVAAVTQMAVNAGRSILQNFYNQGMNVIVSFGKNAVGDNTVTDFEWSQNLAETEIVSDGSSSTIYGDGTRVMQQKNDASRKASIERAWHAAKRLGYMPPNPEAAGITIGANMFTGTGGSWALNIGFVGNKLAIWQTAGAGFGTPDASTTFSVWAAEYTGEGSPTFESVLGEGDSFNGTIEVGPVGAAVSYARGFDNTGSPVWHTGSIGISFGLPLAPIKGSVNYQRTQSTK